MKIPGGNLFGDASREINFFEIKLESKNSRACSVPMAFYWVQCHSQHLRPAWGPAWGEEGVRNFQKSCNIIFEHLFILNPLSGVNFKICVPGSAQQL